MATPRHRLVDAEIPLHYHIVSRCVRRAWLCGTDPSTGINYNHRKSWIVSRLKHLAKYFAIAIDGYAVMSNHFHLVIYYDPLAASTWSDEEVAHRWYEAFPPRFNGEIAEDQKPLMRSCLIENRLLLEKRRQQLGSLSAFMQHLKQPIGFRANREDGTDGHFFEQRFYSGALLDDAALIASMAYVDLNPVRANITRSIKGCRNTSIEDRLAKIRNTPEALEQAIGPIVSGLGELSPQLPLSLNQYVQRLTSLVEAQSSASTATNKAREKYMVWQKQLKVLSKKQRAFGLENSLTIWIAKRSMRFLESAIPST